MNFFHILQASNAILDPSQFDLSRFVHNLQHMGVGMVVIFVVIGIIALTTMLINWLFSEK